MAGRRLAPQACQSLDDQASAVRDKEVGTQGVLGDVDRQRLAGEVGPADLRDQTLGLGAVLARSVEVGDAADQRRRASLLTPGIDERLAIQLGLAVCRKRSNRGRLVIGRRTYTGVDPTRRGGEEERSVALPWGGGEPVERLPKGTQLQLQCVGRGARDPCTGTPVSYTHLRAHETDSYL